jgi:TRAP-type C4-dicarboxylate transport system permease small subunit
MLRMFSMFLAGIGGLCTCLMMLQIVVDVISRWLFAQPVTGTVEIVSNYYLVALTFLPLGAIQLADRHIAVDLFIQFVPASLRPPLAIAMTMLALGFSGWLAAVSFDEASGSYGIGEVIETGASVMIIWPSRFILAVGIGVMVVAIAVQFIGQLRRGSAGRTDI